MKSASELLSQLEDETCDLRCIDVPTGADDYIIDWVVIEHHLDEPKERIIGRGGNPVDALNDAFSK